MRISTPREISSADQGALTPTTARLVTKAAVEHIGAATPMAGDDPAAAARTPWANLSVDTTTAGDATAVPTTVTATTATRHQATAMRAGASHHVPLQPGLLPERYTADLTHWQSPADLPERRLMVQRIIAMTRNKRLDGATAAGLVSTTALCVDRTPSLAKRIELSLYSRAASFSEYCDLNTLRRRLQSLVSLSFHEAAVTRRAALAPAALVVNAVKPPPLGKRKLRVTAACSGPQRLIKRLRTSSSAPANQTQLPDCSTKSDVSTKSDGSTKFDAAPPSLFDMNDDVLQQIWSFVPGVDTIRSCAVNTYAASILPRCVFTLTLDVATLGQAFATVSPSFLVRLPNLTSLRVINTTKPSDAFETGPSLHAWGCSELDMSHDNVGEDVVKQLAEALELGACRKLVHLRLVSVFTNTCRTNALHMLCAALVKGACPVLEDLLLGGNGFSDVGTVDIAWLVRCGSLPQLQRLDIRRNFIGESGLTRIMAALAAGRCARLKYLCMGGNIITDNCVAPVVDLLASALCPQLRFLGLEDNFLSARGVHSIIEAAVAGGMMPKLHHVASDGRGGTDEAEVPVALDSQQTQMQTQTQL